MENPTTPTTAEIRLMGRRIALKTTDSDPDFIAEVVDLVSSRIEAVEKRITATQVPHQIVLLALLDLAEEYIRAKKRVADYKSEIEIRSEALFKTIEGESGLYSEPTRDSEQGVPTA